MPYESTLILLIIYSLRNLYANIMPASHEGQYEDLVHVIAALHLNMQSHSDEVFKLDSSVNGYGAIIDAIETFGMLKGVATCNMFVSFDVGLYGLFCGLFCGLYCKTARSY